MRPLGLRYLALTTSIAWMVLAARPALAHASCPELRADGAPECQPSAAGLQPGAFATTYFPKGQAFLGGGAELVLFTWFNNSDRSGPGQGKFRFDVAGMGSASDTSRKLLLYRGGFVMSFEPNASRRFLIPYVTANVGGLYETVLKSRGFFDPGGGLYLVYLDNVIVDVEGSYVFPFSAADQLSGPKVQLTASFTVW